MNFTSPYNFVPLNSDVLLPELQNISQDFPILEGINGVLEIEIKNLNELILGDSNIENSSMQPFFKTPDNLPAIPGTSLKGMIRNLLEIATASFIQMDENQFSQRDLGNAKNDYMTTLKGKKTGWLFWDSSEQVWKIAPTQNGYKTIRHTQDVTHNQKNANTDIEHILEDLLPNLSPSIHKIEKAVDRYKAIHKAKPKSNKIGAAVEILQGKYLVVTNQLEGCSKRREFLFTEPNYSKAKIIDAEIFSKFEYVMDSSQTEVGAEHWQFLKNYHKEGIPVFFLQNSQNEISGLGLPSLFRLPYEKSLFDLLPQSHRNINTKDLTDFAGLLFGEIPTSNQKSISRKGRVSFSIAKTKIQGDFQEKRLVLSNPKPTYYPAYLKQSPNELKNYNKATQISGFKRYLPHETIKKSRIPLKNDGSENFDVTKSVEVLTSKHTFHAKVRIHNLTNIELGALIWALTLGELNDNPNYQHLIGMGKPLGYGKIKISLKALDIIHNNTKENNTITSQSSLDSFYAFLGSNNLLNGALATLKASNRKEVVKDSELNYLILDPSHKKDDFQQIRKQRKSLSPLNSSLEEKEIKDIEIRLKKQIDKLILRKKEIQDKLIAEQAQKEAKEAERLADQQKQERLSDRTAYEALYEDTLNETLDKNALQKLSLSPELWLNLEADDKIRLAKAIKIGPYFVQNKRKGVKKKFENLLPLVDLVL